jgi:hypothetical protein
VRPDAELEAVQSVAPLDRALDRYGLYEIDGPTTIALVGAGLDGTTAGTDWDAVTDWFAPAQFDDMTRTEKLAAPSYEEMTAGVRFGAGGVSFPEAEAATVTPDYEVRILDEEATRKGGRLPLKGTLLAATAALALEPSLRRPARTVTSASFGVGSTPWALADATTGGAAGSTGTYREALAGLATALAADPGVRGAIRIAPEHALAAPTAKPPPPPPLRREERVR